MKYFAYSGYFFMMSFINLATDLLRQQTIRFEWYFLGHDRERELTRTREVNDEIHILRGAEEFCDASIVVAPHETLIVIGPDRDSQTSLGWKASSGWLLSPSCLEDTVPLLKRATRVIGEPTVIVAKNLSQIAMRREGGKQGDERIYDRCFARQWLALKVLKIMRGFRLIIVDHEATLGKKK